MTKTKWILFDIGGVLVDWHMSWIISEISKRFQLSENLVDEAFFTYLHLLDRGKIAEKIFWEKIPGLDSRVMQSRPDRSIGTRSGWPDVT